MIAIHWLGFPALD